MVRNIGDIVDKPTFVVKVIKAQSSNLNAYAAISKMQAIHRRKLKGIQRCVLHEMARHASRLKEIRDRRKAFAAVLYWLLYGVS